MEIGLLGLPGSGKTTVFNALTGQTASTTPSGKIETNQAIVKVGDPRVDKLSEIFQPKKTIHATIHYVDIVGLQTMDGTGLPAQALQLLGEMDMMLVVVRNFDGGLGAPDVPSDVESIDLEMTISDLQKVENRIDKIDKQIMRVKGPERDQLQIEKTAILKAHKPLEEGRPMRELDFTDEELKAIRGFQFLTLKPVLYLINCEDVEQVNDPATLALLSDKQGRQNTGVDLLAGAIEEEIAQIGDEDRAEFLESYGIEKPSSERIIRSSYDLLGTISFLTCGADEVRAWTIKRGWAAPQAAGAIHSDFEKGFIRAEVAAYADIVEHGSMKACREHAKLRTEGKTYIVQDGDVIEFLFSK